MNPWDVHDANLERESYREDSYGDENPADVHSMLDYRNKAEYYANLAKELVDENTALRNEYFAYIKEMKEARLKDKADAEKANVDMVEQIAALKRERDRLIDRNELLSIRIQNLENLNG